MCKHMEPVRMEGDNHPKETTKRDLKSGDLTNRDAEGTRMLTNVNIGENIMVEKIKMKK